MLFRTFKNQKQRSKSGGSAFIEIQFCTMPVESAIEELVEVDNIENWKNDSLYVYIDDDSIFYDEYSHIFDCGTYNNLKTGRVDLHGINYYAPTFTDSIIKKINNEKPTDYEILIEWLNKSKSYNGFYILGL